MDKKDLKKRMLFIVGRGRSGTTLLQTILNTHPKISVAEEGQFMMLLKGRYSKGSWNKERIKAFYDDLWLERRLENWSLNKEQLIELLLSFGNEASYSDLCATVYANNAMTQEKDDDAWLGDKNPHYALFLNDIMEVFPDAKFIHIVRDYRDTVLSYQNVDFDPDWTTPLAQRWVIYNNEVLKYRNKHPDKFIELKFEDLLTLPFERLTAICNFLGIEFYEEMLEFYKGKDREYWNRNWQQMLSKPLDSSRIYTWRKKMKEEDIKICDVICGEMATQFGYEPEFNLSAPTISTGRLYGSLLTFLERNIYKLPLGFTSRFLTLYRRATKSLD